MKPIIFAFSAFLFATIPAAAQRKLPDSAQPAPRPALNAPQPATELFQRFRYRMAYSAQGTHVAGFQDVVIKSGGSGAPAQAPKRVTGMNKNTDVTLKRGVVRMDSSFNQWTGRAKEPRKPQDVVIDSFDEAGRRSSSMLLSGCVVAEYQGMPDLDGPANTATIEFMKLRCASVKRLAQ